MRTGTPKMILAPKRDNNTMAIDLDRVPVNICLLGKMLNF
jgi:hypothetical protein